MATDMPHDAARMLEESLLNVWSERDGARRRQVMQQIYAPDIIFYETADAEPITGHQLLDVLIAGLQVQWPAEFVFTLTKPPVANHGVALITWTLGAPGAAPAASGHDIALVEHGLIQTLYLYLDAPTG